MTDLAADLPADLGGDVLTKDLSEIIGIVRFRGDFRNVRRFPDANITTEIQAAWAELYELIADTNEGYFDTEDTVTTTANVAYVALPEDAWRVRGVDRLDGADWIPLIQVGVGDRCRYTSSTDTPRAYRLTARGIDLFSTPNAAYTLRVTYTPVAPYLDSTQLKYYNAWEEYVIYGALVRLALNEERDAGDWQKQLDFQRARIARGASQRKAQEPEYLQLREGDIDPEMRWW